MMIIILNLIIFNYSSQQKASNPGREDEGDIWGDGRAAESSADWDGRGHGKNATRYDESTGRIREGGTEGCPRA